MNFGLALLAVERELPIPAWGFGLIAFVILHLMLFITISIGKGPPAQLSGPVLLRTAPMPVTNTRAVPR